jgi:regulator of sirC expression with transglutaminase-like and TPR domain
MLFCERASAPANKVEVSDTELLKDLLARRPSAIELDRVALEIARLEHPELDAGRFIAELDRYAFEIAVRADDLSDGPRFVEAANDYLFRELGLRGNNDDYYHPDNSCLNRVIESKQGMPISLSVIYMEVSRRLAKPVEGIGLPGHFLVRYDDGDFATYIDPFHGGTLLDAQGCCQLAQVEWLEPEFLAPVDRRSIAMRMINNLRNIYFTRRDSAQALKLLDLLIAAEPESADEHKQRAVVLLQMKRIAPALTAFRRYLELAPEAADRQLIEEQIQNLGLWLASRN